jgi:hypothetical protein
MNFDARAAQLFEQSEGINCATRSRYPYNDSQIASKKPVLFRIRNSAL